MLDRRTLPDWGQDLRYIPQMQHLFIETLQPDYVPVSLQMSPMLSFLNSMNTEKEVWSTIHRSSIFSHSCHFFPFSPRDSAFHRLACYSACVWELFNQYPTKLVIWFWSYLPIVGDYQCFPLICSISLLVSIFHSSKSFISTIYSKE